MYEYRLRPGAVESEAEGPQMFGSLVDGLQKTAVPAGYGYHGCIRYIFARSGASLRALRRGGRDGPSPTARRKNCLQNTFLSESRCTRRSLAFVGHCWVVFDRPGPGALSSTATCLCLKKPQSRLTFVRTESFAKVSGRSQSRAWIPFTCSLLRL